MALRGNYIKYTYSNHPTETTNHVVTYPSDLSEDHPDYDKRGTSESFQEPVIVEETETLENIYLVVTGVSIEKHLFTEGHFVGYAYRVYPSQESRNENIENYIWQGSENLDWDDDTSSSPLVVAYEHLKNQKECVNLTNA